MAPVSVSTTRVAMPAAEQKTSPVREAEQLPLPFGPRKSGVAQ